MTRHYLSHKEAEAIAAPGDPDQDCYVYSAIHRPGSWEWQEGRAAQYRERLTEAGCAHEQDPDVPYRVRWFRDTEGEHEDLELRVLASAVRNVHQVRLDEAGAVVLEALAKHRHATDPDAFGPAGHVPNLIVDGMTAGLQVLAQRAGLDDGSDLVDNDCDGLNATTATDSDRNGQP